MIGSLAIAAIFAAVILPPPGTGGDELAAMMENLGPGDRMMVPPGVYKFTRTVTLKADAADDDIEIGGEGEARPVFDFSAMPFDSKNRGISLRGSGYRLRGLEICNAGDNAVNVSGNDNRLTDLIVHDNSDTGIQLSGTASRNRVEFCQSYRNFDRPTGGENADGFAAKGKNIGPGNVFAFCRAWNNADDGWDLWEAPSPVRIEHCMAIENGKNVWNAARFTGNGNGFKLGGNFVAADHVVTHCVSIGHALRAFNQNNNSGAITLSDCVAADSATGFYFPAPPKVGRHVLRRCVTDDSPVCITPNSELADNAFRVIGPANNRRAN